MLLNLFAEAKFHLFFLKSSHKAKDTLMVMCLIKSYSSANTLLIFTIFKITEIGAIRHLFILNLFLFSYKTRYLKIHVFLVTEKPGHI